MVSPEKYLQKNNNDKKLFATELSESTGEN
jgi:hypothetical protein